MRRVFRGLPLPTPGGRGQGAGVNARGLRQEVERTRALRLQSRERVLDAQGLVEDGVVRELARPDALQEGLDGVLLHDGHRLTGGERLAAEAEGDPPRLEVGRRRGFFGARRDQDDQDQETHDGSF